MAIRVHDLLHVVSIFCGGTFLLEIQIELRACSRLPIAPHDTNNEAACLGCIVATRDDLCPRSPVYVCMLR